MNDEERPSFLLIAFNSVFRFFFDILESIVVALAIFVVVYLFLFQPHQVKGASMEPNFHDGEYILTNKFQYHFEAPKRGDVIVFKSPQNPDIDYIKRVIGLPGDRIKLIDNHFYINGTKLEEVYIDAELFTYNGQYLKDNTEVIIPQDYYFVAGDNRPRSSDSREWGPIERSSIIGKSQFRYWPFDRMGLIKSTAYPNVSN
ncbi:signal peptidase I [Candidatus Microgenomates bacterium]|nr:MAG: signal peptidase I [Candidatus Microgenomates bacterium]